MVYSTIQVSPQSHLKLPVILTKPGCQTFRSCTEPVHIWDLVVNPSSTVPLICFFTYTLNKGPHVLLLFMSPFYHQPLSLISILLWWSHAVPIWVFLLETFYNFWVHQPDPFKLITQCYPLKQKSRKLLQ